MKKLITVLLVLILSAIFVDGALADNETAVKTYYTDQYTITDKIDAVYDLIKSTDLEVESNASGQISVSLLVKTYDTVEKLGFSSLKVQRWNGSTWVTDAEVTNQYSYTTKTFSYTDTFTGLYSGALYRVKVTISARRTLGEAQSMTVTSNVINCH